MVNSSCLHWPSRHDGRINSSDFLDQKNRPSHTQHMSITKTMGGVTRVTYRIISSSFCLISDRGQEGFATASVFNQAKGEFN